MVRILLERGHKVRAMVHKQDQRSENLKHQGAETVVCDFLELKGLRLALAGVSGAYFGYPVAPGLIEAAALFAQAARETHLEVIVNMSQVSARSDAFSDATIAHWMSERVFDWSGVKTTHKEFRLKSWIDNLNNFLPLRVLQHFRNGPYRDMPSG